MRGDRTIGRQIGIGDVTAREQEAAVFTVCREFRRTQVVNRTLTTFQPLRIERSNNRGINLVHLLNEVAQLIDEGLDVHQAFKVQHAEAIKVNWVSNPTYRQVLDVRRFTAQQCHNAVGITLAFQRLQVVCDRNQVHFRRQLHCRVTPATVSKNA